MHIIVKLRDYDNRPIEDINKLYDCLERFIDKFALKDKKEYEYLKDGCEFRLTDKQYTNLRLRLGHLPKHIYDVESVDRPVDLYILGTKYG
jgi:hypothetical protein